MIRRSRISVRPNVSALGRTGALATPQDAPPKNQKAEVKEGNYATAAVVTSTAPGDDQSGEGTISSAVIQRRKRFSIKPKVAPALTRTSARTPKSPVKAVSESPVQDCCSNHDEPATSSQVESTVPQGLRSPSRRRPSGESRQPRAQPKLSLPSTPSPAATAVPAPQDTQELAQLSADEGKTLEYLPVSQAKEVPPKPPDKVPPSLPDREATEISERAKTLVSKSTKRGLSPPKFTLSRLLNDQSDLQRLAKARKLRELLRQEMHKDKKHRKLKARAKEYTPDPAKMTMRDLIYYLPISNPMTSYFEESMQENETVVPPSPAREESPERAQEPEIHSETTSQREDDEGDADEDQDEPMMVPRVKVAEDGSLIIDEESLTVEVMRAKGPNPAEDRDPIFERGSTTTYSSFRKGTHTKPWSSEETDMFFLAISMVGTDFSMICQLFPHRSRSEIKNKFKKEERENAWRIDKAFRERRKLDIEFFSKLLEKILEAKNNKSKKPKSPSEKKAVRKRSRKAKGKKLSDVEEEEEEEGGVENGTPELEELKGQKEKENTCDEGETGTFTPKRKRRKKNEGGDSTETPKDKKMKTGKKTDEQGEACIPEDAEAALPEDHSTEHRPEKTEPVKSARGPTIKPAQLSRGRAPKPLVPLGRKFGKMVPSPSTKAKDGAPDTGQESSADVASEQQVDKDKSPSSPAKTSSLATDDETFSEDEVSAVPPSKPTRYGRMPKPIQHLNYPAKEDAPSPASEASPGSASPAGSLNSAAKPKRPARKDKAPKTPLVQQSKKSKLVTLRACPSEYSDDEEEKQREAEEVEEQHDPTGPDKDSSAPVFVPVGLRSPQPVVAEVEETMEELDILVNVPDVLGISQDALCPDASCEQAQDVTGTVPCEHQLDLLADVIDFLSTDHMEVSEKESYNEAAQTLLTIGNLAHVSHSTQNHPSAPDRTTGAPSVSGNEACSQKEEIASEPVAQVQSSATPPLTETSGPVATETSQAVHAVSEDSTIESSPISQIGDVPSQSRSGRLPKVKLKPNLVQPTRIAESKTQPVTSSVEESSTVPPVPSGVTPSQSVAEESFSSSTESVPVSLHMPTTAVELQYESALTVPIVTTENSSPTPRTSVSDIRESQVVQESLAVDSVPDHESSEEPATTFRPVEELPAGQEKGSEVGAPSQITRSRFSKVKPKPHLGQTSRSLQSKPGPGGENADAHLRPSSPTSKQQSADNTMEQLEPQSTCSTTAQAEPPLNSSPTSASVPSLETSSTLTPALELSACEEKRANVGLSHHVDLSSEGSEKNVPQKARRRFSKVKPKPNIGSSTRSTRSKSTQQPTENNDKISKQDLLSSPNVSSEQQQPVIDNSTHSKADEHLTPPHPFVMTDNTYVSKMANTVVSAANEPSTREEKDKGVEVQSQVPQVASGQNSKDTFPHLSTVCKESKCEPNPLPQPLEQSLLHAEPDPLQTEPLHTTDTDTNFKTKLSDNLGEHPLVLESVQHIEHQVSVSRDEVHNTAPESPRLPEEIGSEIFTSEPTVIQNSWLIENPFLVIDSDLSELSPTTATPTEESSTSQAKVEAESPLQRVHSPRPSTRTAESKCLPVEDAAPILELQSSENVSTESKVKPGFTTNAHSTPETKESTQQLCLESSDVIHAVGSELKGHDALQQLSENAESSQATKADSQEDITADTESKPLDSDQSCKKAPCTRRARFPKPKPNLGCSSRPLNPQPVQDAKQPEAVFGTCSEAPEDSHRPEPKPSSDILEPVEGAATEYISNDNLPHDVSALVSMTQMPVSSSKDATSQGAVGNQSYPVLTTHPEVLTDQTPSDTEEPFFILSLTEVPVFPSGEEVGTVSEPPPYLPATDAPTQLQSAPGSPGGGEAGVLCNVPVPVSLDGCERGSAGVEEAEPGLTVRASSIPEKPEDPHENAEIQAIKQLDAADNSEETGPPHKRRILDTGRRAKLQVKPNTTGKKQPSRTFTAKEAKLATARKNTTRESELPCPPAKPETFGAMAGTGNEVFTEPQKETGGLLGAERSTHSEGMDRSEEEHQTSITLPPRTVPLNRPGRKPKGFLSFLSDKSNAPSSVAPGQTKAAPQAPQVKTSRAGRKRAAPAPSTTRAPLDLVGSVAPTPATTEPREAAQSTSTSTATPARCEPDTTQVSDVGPLLPDPVPSTSQCTAAAPAAELNDSLEVSSVDEELTNVSQYFLSDIFTEVDD
ncbi:uncharacterized protein ACJ7VT_010842 isoform 2-T2 [Polymixia lowei]